MSDVLFPYEGVILDACVIINLYASGHMQSILEFISKPVSIAAYVHEMEALRIYMGPEEDVAKETELINLQSFVERRLLHIVPIEDGPETAACCEFFSRNEIRYWGGYFSCNSGTPFLVPRHR